MGNFIKPNFGFNNNAPNFRLHPLLSNELKSEVVAAIKADFIIDHFKDCRLALSVVNWSTGKLFFSLRICTFVLLSSSFRAVSLVP
jgi:hypothetical protein